MKYSVRFFKQDGRVVYGPLEFEGTEQEAFLFLEQTSLLTENWEVYGEIRCIEGRWTAVRWFGRLATKQPMSLIGAKYSRR